VKTVSNKLGLFPSTFKPTAFSLFAKYKKCGFITASQNSESLSYKVTSLEEKILKHAFFGKNKTMINSSKSPGFDRKWQKLQRPGEHNTENIWFGKQSAK
jgi:hypothetical protein